MTMYKYLNLAFSALFLIFSATAMADEVEYDFTKSIPEGWTSTQPQEFDTSDENLGLYLTASSTLTFSNVANLHRIMIVYTSQSVINTMNVAYCGDESDSYKLYADKTSMVTFVANAEATGDLNINVNCAENGVYIKTIVLTTEKNDEPEIIFGGHTSVSEFLQKADPQTAYELTGIVQRITNKKYGNFDLVENGASVFIYGLLDLEGRTQKFSDLNIKEGDELTLTGVYVDYNGKAEIVDAQFVSLKKAVSDDENVGGDDENAEGLSFDFSRSVPSSWSVTTAPLQFETQSPARGAQFTSDSELRLTGVKNVTNVRIVYSGNNTAMGNSINVSVAGNDWGMEEVNKVTDATRDFASSESATGDVVVTITRTAKSVWIKQIIISCSDETDNIVSNYSTSQSVSHKYLKDGKIHIKKGGLIYDLRGMYVE